MRVKSLDWLVLAGALLFAASCGGSSGPGDQDPDPDPDDDVPAGDMVISGISPATPWLDEEFTVTGSGFGTTPSRYTVRFVECVPDGCTVNVANVLQASETQLRIKINSPPGTARLKRGKLRLFWNNLDGTFKNVTSANEISFKVPPSMDLEENYDYPFDPPVMRAGDLLSFIVQGHYPTNQLSPMIAGVAAEVINDPNDPPNGEPPHRSTELEPLTGTWRIFVRLQPRMLGTGPIEEPASQQQVPVSFSGEEGRVYEGLERAFRTPTYTVTSASPSTIDLSDGTQLTISGTNMPGQILVRWYSGTTYLESTANGCADVCNSVTAPPPAGITPGTYEIVAHLSVFTQETVVGLGNVTVVP